MEHDAVFVREDLTEEQRLFGRTAAEFMRNEVLPVVGRLYSHDWVLTRQLLKKASELDLLNGQKMWITNGGFADAHASSEVVSALTSRGAGATLAEGAGRLTAFAGVDRIAARRRVAAAVIEAGSYQF